jgi:hypothetical protein
VQRERRGQPVDLAQPVEENQCLISRAMRQMRVAAFAMSFRLSVRHTVVRCHDFQV